MNNNNKGKFNCNRYMLFIPIIITFTTLTIIYLLLFPIANAQKSSANVSDMITNGNALRNLGNDTGAIEYYDKVLAIDPTKTDALYNKGNALRNMGNYTGAIEYYDKALAIDPTNKVALKNKENVIARMIK